MSVSSKRPHSVNIPFDDYETLKKIASRKRTSVSKVLLQAAMGEMSAERAQRAKMLSIVGLGHGSEESSESHDKALYAR